MVASPPSDELLQALSQFGFGQYEARAYCALLARSPMNGYEVARASGVPPSKIYETLGRLAEKGAVLIQHSEPVSYAANPSEAVLDAARTKFQRAMDAAEAGFQRLPRASETGQIWSLTDRDAAIAAAQRLIEAARASVFAAVWDDELPSLRPMLEAAARRGCVVHVALYGTGALSGPSVYDLNACGRSAMARLAGRRLTTVVADAAKALIATFHGEGMVDAVITSNVVVNLLATEYVKADVLGRLLIDDMGEARFEALRHDPGRIEALLRS